MSGGLPARANQLITSRAVPVNDQLLWSTQKAISLIPNAFDWHQGSAAQRMLRESVDSWPGSLSVVMQNMTKDLCDVVTALTSMNT